MAIENPLWMDPNPSTGLAPEYSARQDRGMIARLFTEGVEDVQAGHLLVAQRAAGANMTVEVAPGAAYVAGDDVARQGTYRVVVTSTESVTIGAAPASNSRIDLVVLRVRDATAIGGTAHGAAIEVIAGVAAASPVAPTVPNTAIPLAQVLVTAGATSIQTAAITDRRAQAGANSIKVATSVQPMTTTQRDALSGPELFDGRVIDNITLGKMQIRRSGAWVDVAPTLPQRKAQGAYSGDGTNQRLITVGFTPDLVVVVDAGGNGFGWLHRDSGSGQSLRPTQGGYLGDYLTTNGFVVTGPGGSPTGALNASGQPYYWTAFKFV